MGVHTNMCVIGRSFGLRAMKRMGFNVVLMRDMTDLMYNHEMPPYVNHFSGLDLMVEYIEAYVCPSVLSCIGFIFSYISEDVGAIVFYFFNLSKYFIVNYRIVVSKEDA